MRIQCKRVYFPAEKDDGYRVLVDRLWPRGIKKSALVYDEWNKAITPSTELRKAFHSELTTSRSNTGQNLRNSITKANGWRILPDTSR